jgi:hypothetical protein
VVTFFRVLPGVQVARVVEPEDDLVLVVVVLAGAEYFRAEVARKPIGGGKDAGDPFFELLLATRFYSP